MKIAIIGSTQYLDMMKEHQSDMVHVGHEAWLPFLDHHCETALDIMEANLKLIRWADEVHLFWDCRSPGAWGDFCMAFALGKVVRAMFLEGKSMRNVVEAYSSKVRGE